MKEPINVFRAYVLDYDFQMMDYKTFLTENEAKEWATQTYPNYSSQITSVLINDSNARYLEILKQYKSDITKL